MLTFDAQTTRLLDTAYQGADITRRRRAAFDALQPGPGETILDIGCGNGLLTAELARAVGHHGRVIGVDPSDDMRQSAIRRCEGFDQVDIVAGTGSEIPVDTGSVDKAVSVQVFEYLDDIPGAVTETHRVLKPGGQLVVGDTHFDSLIWFSRQPDRMDRMNAAWSHHFTQGAVPALLPPILKQAGFVTDSIQPFTFCDHQLKPDGLANMLMILMENYAVANGHVPRDEAAAWAEEQRSLAAEGCFFFSVTFFVVCARKA